jgi:hypothetical protein
MNMARLRADIDAGKTGDKTPGEDPAAAPLGTDEEAAGTPVDRTLAERVRRAERRPEGDALSRQNATPRAKDAGVSHKRSVGMGEAVMWLGAGAAAGAAIALEWAMVR